jgi:glycerophosphoryl diester phosphodiesterase
MIVCAHRGASSALPGNSLAAFNAAIDSGCEMIETDVRAAFDGRLVLAHDPISRYDPDPVALLDLLELARGRIGLDLELKEHGLQESLLAALADWNGESVVSSFLPDALQAVSDLDPTVTTGLLVEPPFDGDPAAVADECGASLMLLEDGLASRAMLARVKRPIWAWTVNDPQRLIELAASPEVRGVITDVPEIAVRLLAGAICA